MLQYTICREVSVLFQRLGSIWPWSKCALNVCVKMSIGKTTAHSVFLLSYITTEEEKQEEEEKHRIGRAQETEGERRN